MFKISQTLPFLFPSLLSPGLSLNILLRLLSEPFFPLERPLVNRVDLLPDNEFFGEFFIFRFYL